MVQCCQGLVLRMSLMVPPKRIQEICKIGRPYNLKQSHQKMVLGMMLSCSFATENYHQETLLKEVRVRFEGFGAEEDEWVNVREAVRQRSVPVDPSECHSVNVGDVVCCFQERKDYAMYYDAHVIEIQRKLHDIRGCRCIFKIRYNHDNVEVRISIVVLPRGAC
ncbi:unnamed protein product [Linum tenue]|uniref:SAWADEE domain-containing protein n=1 Tax=Linum tenue TaxID=586396 RepID=A0AAV0JI13_9ROSI|nr:unnamed protein product [Linum tenue]